MEMLECENMFREALKQGIALFCGAGFSVEARDWNSNNLPIGRVLLDELKREFSSITAYKNLPRACTKLENTDKKSFYNFLKRRFCVKDFNPLYNELIEIRINGIYTTNIDDLFFKIYENNESQYFLHDCSEMGKELYDNHAIPYFPLHGCVRCEDKGYVFGLTEIASAFSERSKEDAWKHLTQEVSNKPVLFWGWNFEDSGPIEAMYGEDSNIDNNIYRWVLLYEKDEEMIDFLHSLKFNVIVGDTLQLLEYIKEFNLECSQHEMDEGDSGEGNLDDLKDYIIPPNDKRLISYPFEDYFSEYSPRWSYVYSHQIYRTTHYKRIVDSIAKRQDVIVIGMRSSGKTTLMMQLLVDYQTEKIKNYMINPSLAQVKRYLKLLNGRKSLLFVDDCLRDTDGMMELLNSRNVQVIGFERDFSYEGQYHRLKNQNFELIDITEIGQEDAQGILDSIPYKLKKENASTKKFDKDPTIINLLSGNLKATNFNFIKNFYKKDELSAKIFLMISYVHSCGVPCSFDMVYSFLDDKKYTWSQMMEAVNRVGGLISECSDEFQGLDIMAQLQDYYQCRSRILAENIITTVSKNENFLKEVLQAFVNNVPIYKICNYDKFRRTGYDANLMSQVFTDISEGEQFYLNCAQKDSSEYLYQQAALYFSQNGEHKKAFEWIDKARNIAHYNRFTVESTYAKIYFDANLLASEQETVKALKILEECCQNDKRKSIHFWTYAQCVQRYCRQYENSRQVEGLLEKALGFIDEGLSDSNKSLSNSMKWRLKDAKRELNHIKLNMEMA